MSRERGGMWCFEYEMAGAIDHTSLASCGASPEEEDDVVTAAVDRLDDSIGEGLPAEALMARCHAGADGEGGVEEEDSLLRPRQEVPIRDDGGLAEVGGDLLLNVHEARRYGDAPHDAREG